jgi:hypothetical protein
MQVVAYEDEPFRWSEIALESILSARDDARLLPTADARSSLTWRGARELERAIDASGNRHFFRSAGHAWRSDVSDVRRTTPRIISDDEGLARSRMTAKVRSTYAGPRGEIVQEGTVDFTIEEAAGIAGPERYRIGQIILR